MPPAAPWTYTHAVSVRLWRGDKASSRLLVKAHKLGMFEASTAAARSRLVERGAEELIAAGFRVAERTERVVVDLMARSGDVRGAAARAAAGRDELLLPSTLPGLILERQREEETSYPALMADIRLMLYHARRLRRQGRHNGVGFLTLSHVVSTLRAFRISLTPTRPIRRNVARTLWELFIEYADADPWQCPRCIAALVPAFSVASRAKQFIDHCARGFKGDPAQLFTSRLYTALLGVAQRQPNRSSFKLIVGELRRRGLAFDAQMKRQYLDAIANSGSWDDAHSYFKSIPVTRTTCLSLLKLCGRRASAPGDQWEQRAEEVFAEGIHNDLESWPQIWRGLMFVYSRTYNAKKAEGLMKRFVAGGNDAFDTQIIVAYSIAIRCPRSVCLQRLYSSRHHSTFFEWFMGNPVLDRDSDNINEDGEEGHDGIDDGIDGMQCGP